MAGRVLAPRNWTFCLIRSSEAELTITVDTVQCASLVPWEINPSRLLLLRGAVGRQKRQQLKTVNLRNYQRQILVDQDSSCRNAAGTELTRRSLVVHHYRAILSFYR